MAEPIKVATDGGCWPNPGPGGWAWVAQDGRYEAGSFGAGTNNVAELLAIRHALLAFPDEPIEIVYDSQYAANSVTQWGPSWRRRGITEKANIELIFEIVDIHQSRPEHARVLWTHAVSYTHLDVYKRQAPTTSTPTCATTNGRCEPPWTPTPTTGARSASARQPAPTTLSLIHI